MERPPFPAYDGDEPYLFVCYGHGDAAVVYPELVWLRDRGFNIWYDEGISPGTVWRDELAQAIEGAGTFLFFVSPRAVESENCLREVHFALDQELPMVPVYLEPTALPPGLRLAISHRQAIHRYELDRSEYERKLRRSLTRVDEKTRSTRPTAATQRSRSRVLVAVEAIAGGDDVFADELVRSITRYVSWHGGAFRAASAAPRRAARALDADYLVELKASMDAGNARLSWQVGQAATAEVVWASRFEESVATAMAKQERIAEMIAEGVLQHVTDYELRRIGGTDLSQLSYGELVLSAGQLNYLDRTQVLARQRQIERAIEIEPRTGLGHALLAELLSWKIANGVGDDERDDARRVHAAAETALRLDPNDPQVLLSVGLTYCRMLDYGKGLTLIRRSLALAPTVKAKDELARSLCFAGEPDEAIALFREILETMPAGHTFPFGRLALALAQAGRTDEALQYSTLATVHFPADYYGWTIHANLLAQAGRDADGQRALAQAQRLVKGLHVEVVIERTAALYGRTDAQRGFLTDGLRRLLAARE